MQIDGKMFIVPIPTSQLV